MITFININAASFSVFFQLPSPPLLLQDKTVAHPFQHFPQFHCQHRHVRVSSKVSVVSLPRTFESLESSSILGNGDDDGDDLLGSGVFTESRFELGTQPLGRD